MAVRELQRARFALDVVRSVTENRGKFKSLVRNATSDIQVNGLAQVLAFWKAKNEPHHAALLGAVSRWVGRDLGLPEETDLLEWLAQPQTTSVDYRRATTSALEIIVWLKRFAEAEIQEPVQQDSR